MTHPVMLISMVYSDGDNNGFVVGWVGGLGDQIGHLGPRVDGEYRQLAVA